MAVGKGQSKMSLEVTNGLFRSPCMSRLYGGISLAPRELILHDSDLFGPWSSLKDPNMVRLSKDHPAGEGFGAHWGLPTCNEIPLM